VAGFRPRLTSGLGSRSTGGSNPSKSLGVYPRATPVSRRAPERGVGHEASDIRTERDQPPARPSRWGVRHETGLISRDVPNPLHAAGIPGRNARVGYVRYGPAATRWCSATPSTMSPDMRLTLDAGGRDRPARASGPSSRLTRRGHRSAGRTRAAGLRRPVCGCALGGPGLGVEGWCAGAPPASWLGARAAMPALSWRCSWRPRSADGSRARQLTRAVFAGRCRSSGSRTLGPASLRRGAVA
jgi:hypothetical protein